MLKPHVSGEMAGQVTHAGSAARILLAVAIAYVGVLFLLLPGNTLVSFPVHHDDFNNLAYTWGTLKWFPIRPVSSMLLQICSASGSAFYYTSLNLLIVVYTSLVLWFLARLFAIKQLSIIPLVAIAAAALSYEHVVEYTKYTGLITNLLSGVFGVGAMCLILIESDREKPRTPILIGIAVLAFLSFWAKEDFVAPVLLVAAFVAWEKWMTQPRLDWSRRWNLAPLVILFCLMTALVFYNRSIGSTFTQAATGFYKKDFSPKSIAVIGWWYIRDTPGAGAAFVVQLLLLLTNFAGLVPWRRLLLFQATIGVIALPYFCLPNHLSAYYNLNWTVWECGGLLLLLKFPRGRILKQTALAAIAIAMIVITQPGRRGIMLWYREKSGVNRNVLATLEENRSLLTNKPAVAVEGAPFSGPWFATDGAFLRNRYGFDLKWIIRVPENSDYLRVSRSLIGTGDRGPVRTVALEQEPVPANLPLLSLRADGRGSVRISASAAHTE